MTKLDEDAQLFSKKDYMDQKPPIPQLSFPLQLLNLYIIHNKIAEISIIEFLITKPPKNIKTPLESRSEGPIKDI